MLSHKMIGPSSTMQFNLAAIKTAYETHVIQQLLVLLSFISQFSKSVNDDTKYYIQKNNDHNYEKQ